MHLFVFMAPTITLLSLRWHWSSLYSLTGTVNWKCGLVNENGKVHERGLKYPCCILCKFTCQVQLLMTHKLNPKYKVKILIMKVKIYSLHRNEGITTLSLHLWILWCLNFQPLDPVLTDFFCGITCHESFMRYHTKPTTFYCNSEPDSSLKNFTTFNNNKKIFTRLLEIPF